MAAEISAEQVKCYDELITDILSRVSTADGKMASKLRLTAGSSAEQVECRDELITDILSRVSTKDVLSMMTVSKRWRTLIFNPDFAYTHFKNRDQPSIFFVDLKFSRNMTVREKYQFRSYNVQTGKLSSSTLHFSWEGLDSSVQNGHFELHTASNGVMYFCPCVHLLLERFTVGVPVFWLYNPVRRISKKLSVPSIVDIDQMYVAELCYTHNTLKFVIVGYSVPEKRQYTLVFDLHSNSWYEGSPLLIDLSAYTFQRAQLFLNGVIYFVVRLDAEESAEIRDVEALSRDDFDILHMIIGYDVNRDQWGFSILVPASVGFIYCLTEWEGNLLVCASNSNHIREGESEDWHCDGQFVFWILDTEHKQWIRERELDLSYQFDNSWKVSASGGVVWFKFDYNSVIVYHMKTGHCSFHGLENAFAHGPFDLGQERFVSFVTFKPTLLSF